MKTLASRLTWARTKAGLSQQELADKAGVAQSTIGSLESGARRTARKITAIAAALGVRAQWLADEIGAPDASSDATVDARPSTIHVICPGDSIPEGFIQIPESKIEFSAGNGRTAHYELVADEEPATYRLDWFQKYGINPERVRRFRVAGDSMEPMLYARDTILVNLAETSVVDGKLYAIRYGDELRVKYLSQRLDGTLLLRSVNPAYSVEEVPPEIANEHISVIGRVRDTSGTGGL